MKSPCMMQGACYALSAKCDHCSKLCIGAAEAVGANARATPRLTSVHDDTAQKLQRAVETQEWTALLSASKQAVKCVSFQ